MRRSIQKRSGGYEAGFKQKLADNRVLLSGAVFYYDYKNLQVSFVNAKLDRADDQCGKRAQLRRRAGA